MREGGPNVGRCPSEDEDENRRSGYIRIYADEEGAADLERFAQFEAHLGGTMLLMQVYPPVSPFYLEFGDTFGGFAFGGVTAQLDLETMRITWASERGSLDHDDRTVPRRRFATEEALPGRGRLVRTLPPANTERRIR